MLRVKFRRQFVILLNCVSLVRISSTLGIHRAPTVALTLMGMLQSSRVAVDVFPVSMFTGWQSEGVRLEAFLWRQLQILLWLPCCVRRCQLLCLLTRPLLSLEMTAQPFYKSTARRCLACAVKAFAVLAPQLGACACSESRLCRHWRSALLGRIEQLTGV